jgi:RNA polymerase sigma-70 factor, ECF subfamily
VKHSVHHQLSSWCVVFMDDDEDLKLVQESQHGSRESFERLIFRYEKSIFNAAYRILRDFEDAKDVTQNVFLKAFQNLEHFDTKHRFFSWIYRIALNESINLCKRRRRLDPVDDTRIGACNTPENLLGRQELGEVVQAALMSLEFKHRVIVVLRHFNDCSYQEMSEILEIPERTVKSRLFTARTLLREILSGKEVL